MCTGAILLYKIPRVVIGENVNYKGDEDLLRERGVEVVVLDDELVEQREDLSLDRDVEGRRRLVGDQQPSTHEDDSEYTP